MEPARGVIRARCVLTASKNRRALEKTSQVVGTIPGAAALACALRLKRASVDLLEVRVDHFANDLAPLLRALPRLPAPLIVTVRDAREGGAVALDVARRRELFARFLSAASYLDLELRSVSQFAGTIAAARANGVQIILSAHFFKTTPSLARLETLRDRAFAAGADIFKVAALTPTLSQVLTLTELLARSPRRALSVMGMGSCGKLSRLLLACAGSVLNYGYLDAVQVAGQWPAPLLKLRIAEFREAGVK